MATIDDLTAGTAEFFAQHWCSPQLGVAPKWTFGWNFQGSVPNHKQSGVYALVNGEGEVLYIGSGVSKGDFRYVEHGLSRRLMAHVLIKASGGDAWKVREKWQEVVNIGTIGFSGDNSYMALALEDFLIGRLRPRQNKRRKPD